MTTTKQLAAEIERLYWADADVRCSSGDGPSEAEQIAVNAHLKTIAEYTARAAARWAKRAKRPMRYQPQFVMERVAKDARDLMEDEKGDKAFTLEDKPILMSEPVGVIAKVFGAVFNATSIEDHTKN